MSSSAAMAAATRVSRNAMLHLHRSVQSIRSVRRTLDPSVSVGFVPTMGALHEGHLSLVRQAVESNDVVVASVFVNPTQFAAGEDLDKYPRQLERDTELLAQAGVDHLFAPPDASAMYGPHHTTFVQPEGFDDIAEGRSRPGHFRGVATVVTKLFNIVQPTNAYFGQKDAAQCVLIQRIAQDLDMDVNVHIADTVREADGLAMSSRNAYLTPTERQAAPIVYQSLCAAQRLYHETVQEQETIPASVLQQAVVRVLQSEPMVSEIQYVSVDNRYNMRPLEHVEKSETGGAVISLAVKIGNVRLIDNIVIW